MANAKTKLSTKNEDKKFKWTKDNIIKLIELYKGSPCLYDTRQKNRDNRRSAVQFIASELQAPGWDGIPAYSLFNYKRGILTYAFYHEVELVYGCKTNA
jgi:Alcohol dehydrogenase transcription factor Myb/SANT-like